MSKSTAIFLIILGALAFSQSSQAADPNSAETKLRETLRNTMLQLRAAEADRDALKVAQDQNDQEKAALTGKLETVTKQSIADKDAAGQTIEAFKVRTEGQERRIAELQESLDKWKAAYEQAAEVAKSKESERSRLAGEKIVLVREVAIRQTKNEALFKLGNEILSRYEKFGLGTALTAREPFVGATRVKLENLVQDYSDKLSAQTVRIGADEAGERAPEDKGDSTAEPGRKKRMATASQHGT